MINEREDVIIHERDDVMTNERDDVMINERHDKAIIPHVQVCYIKDNMRRLTAR